MSLSQIPRKLLQAEDGSFLSTAIFLAIIIAIVAVAVIDGASVLYAYRGAGDAADAASQNAYNQFKLYRNEATAEQVAAETCQERGAAFVSAVPAPQVSANAFTVTCEEDANTKVIQHLPWFRNLIHQQASSTWYSSV